MQRQVVSGGRVEFTDAHRAWVGKLNRSFRSKLENPYVGNRGIKNEVGAGPARIHGKLAEILERDVRREINRTVNRRQRQHVKPRERQCAARWSGGDSIHSDQDKVSSAAIANIDDWIARKQQALELKPGERQMSRVGEQFRVDVYCGIKG